MREGVKVGVVREDVVEGLRGGTRGGVVEEVREGVKVGVVVFGLG